MKSALVIGCSASVWEEAEAALRLARFDAIYCVKQAGIYYPRFDVWVTLHPEAMDDYETQRQALGLSNGYEIVAPPPSELGMHGKKGNIARRVSYRWDQEVNSSASSGIYGAKIALDDGFDKVVLAGVPMSPEQGHFMPQSKTVDGRVRGNVWTQHGQFVVGLNIAIPRLIRKVKSMSGYTMKVLGAPTQEWFRA